MGEIWRDIEGYNGLYQVSDQGRVRSLSRQVRHPRKGWMWRRGVVLSSKRVNRKKYIIVALCKDGVITQRTVHSLVARAFIANPQWKPEINHKDGDRHNNKRTNLEWVTRKENADHAARMGFYPSRNNLRHAKLTEEECRDVVKRRKQGSTYQSIADDYNVTVQCIFAICEKGGCFIHRRKSLCESRSRLSSTEGNSISLGTSSI